MQTDTLVDQISALKRSNQRLRAALAFSLLASASFVLLGAQQMEQKLPQPNIHQIFEDSRKERNNAMQSNRDALFAQARAHDVERRGQVHQLLESSALQSAQDFHEAAFIFQHGETPQDYLLAHILADAAVAKGDAPSRWWAAAALDRYLQTAGQAQVFGTQYMNPHATQEPYDKDLIPDSLRKEFCVPTYAGQQQNRDAINKGKDWPFPDGCH